MKTKWTDATVSQRFDAYDDHVETVLGYRPLIEDLKKEHGTAIEVLDYGCGGGKVSRRLIEAGIKRVTGVDISTTMIDKASANPVRDSIRYLRIDSAVIPLPDHTFDAAVCCYVFINIHSREELRSVAREIFRVLKPGGTLLLLDTNPLSVGIRFASFRNGDPGVLYRDGDARPVYLDVPSYGVFEIVDTHWELGTYEQVLQSAGFANVESLQRTASDLWRSERSRLGESEMRNPPFVVFKARKTADV